MEIYGLAVLVVLGLTLVIVQHVAQRQLLAKATPAAPAELPFVSVLKPMRGLDPGLEANLHTIFRQEYPRFEVLLGVADPDDRALVVARRVAARYPNVPSRVVVDGRRVGANPKVNNLANLRRHASGDLILISDSNVSVEPGYLFDLVSHHGGENVGLVSSPIRALPGSSLGSQLESLQLNTFVMGGVAALSELCDSVCVVGKSMLMRREMLDELGGFPFLGRFLAEDQVCGEEVVEHGRKVTLSGRPVDNRIGPIGLRGFAGRHLRWARIRRFMCPAGYAGELLLNPVFVATIGAAIVATPTALAIAGGALLVKAAFDAAAERALGIRRPLVVYPALVAAKDLSIGLLWPLAWFGREVNWRGNAYRMTARTELIALAPAAVPDVLAADAFPSVVPELDPFESELVPA